MGCLIIGGITNSGESIAYSGTFESGEIVSVDVTMPSDGATTATLAVNGIDRDSTAIPGTAQYTIPSDGSYSIVASVDGSATFDFNCSLDPGDPGDPGDTTTTVQPSGDYCDSGEAFGKSVSAKAKAGEKKGKDGYKPGDHKGFSSCRHGDADGG